MDYGPYSPGSSPPNSDEEEDLVYDSPSDEEIDYHNKEKSSIYKKIGVWFFVFIWILYMKYPNIFIDSQYPASCLSSIFNSWVQ